MQDILFKKLQTDINEFISVGNQAFTKISKSGERCLQAGSLAERQNYWRKILDQVQQKTDQLNVFFAQQNFHENKDELNARLAYLRELSRLTGESPPEWSANYPSIRDALGKIYDSRIAIDKKYQLGKHKLSKQIRAYQQARDVDGS